MSSIYSALEAISHQGISALAMDIELALTELRKLSRVGQLDMANSGVAKSIKKHTGLSLSIHVVPGFQACVVPAFTGINNVMYNDWNKGLILNRDTNAVLEAKSAFDGTIDLKRSKVSGDFAHLYSEIYIGEVLLFKDSKFTPAETTAIILHEVGHVFVIMEMIARFSRTNYVMEAAMKRMLDSETPVQRIQILQQLENIYGDTIPDKDRIAASKKGKNYYRTVFMTLAVRESQSQLGHNLYDLRGFEQLADQFASRHGMGKDLALALDKLHRATGDRVYWGTPVYYLVMVFEFIIFMSATLLTWGLFPLLMAAANYDIYDPMPRRVEKFKLDAIDALKNEDISKKDRKILLENIKVFDSLLDEMKDNEDFGKLFWNTIMPWGRKQKRDIVFNEQLERMLNNSLYAAAAELKS